MNIFLQCIDYETESNRLKITKTDMRSWHPNRFENIQLLELHLNAKYYKLTTKEKLLKLFEYLKNIKTVHLASIGYDVNFDDFAMDFKIQLNRVTGLRLTTFDTITGRSLAHHFPSVNAIYAEKAFPTLLNGFVKIERLIIRIDDRISGTLKDGLYIAHIQANEATLRQLNVISTTQKCFEFFVKNIIDLVRTTRTRLEKIAVVWDVDKGSLNYVVRRFDAREKSRGLKSGDLRHEAMEVLRLNSLSLDERLRRFPTIQAIYTEENVKSMNLNVLDRIERFIIRGTSNTGNQAGELVKSEFDKLYVDHIRANRQAIRKFFAFTDKETFSYIIGSDLMKKIREFSLENQETSDSVTKTVIDTTKSLLKATIHSGSYYPKLLIQDVQVIEFKLPQTDQKILDFYSMELSQLKNVVELKLNDDNGKLLAMALEIIVKMPVEEQPWSQLKAISARIKIDDEAILMEIIICGLVEQLEMIEFFGLSGEDVVIATVWFYRTGWPIMIDNEFVVGGMKEASAKYTINDGQEMETWKMDENYRERRHEYESYC